MMSPIFCTGQRLELMNLKYIQKGTAAIEKLPPPLFESREANKVNVDPPNRSGVTLPVWYWLFACGQFYLFI